MWDGGSHLQMSSILQGCRSQGIADSSNPIVTSLEAAAEERHSFWVRLAILRFIVELAGVSGLRSCERGLWGQIFVLGFGEHRETGLPIRQEEDSPWVPGNGN